MQYKGREKAAKVVEFMSVYGTTLSTTHIQVPLISGTLRLHLSFCAHSNHSMGIMNEPTCKPREERRRLFRTNYLMQIAATSSYSQQPLSGLLFFVAVISTYYLCHTVYFFCEADGINSYSQWIIRKILIFLSTILLVIFAAYFVFLVQPNAASFSIPQSSIVSFRFY